MKFKVKVTITAKRTYHYELDAASQRKAEDAAVDKAIGEFHVTADDIEDNTDVETEQQTRNCARCGKEFHLHTADRSLAESEAWYEDDDYCAKCGATIVSEEAGLHHNAEGAR
jgi:ribosomal protein S27AE